MIKIDLNSPDGNAFALAGIALRWQKDLSMKKQKSIIKDAKSYEDVVSNFIELFKDKVSFKFLNSPQKLCELYPGYCEEVDE